jgi:hypothetical protein
MLIILSKKQVILFSLVSKIEKLYKFKELLEIALIIEILFQHSFFYQKTQKQLFDIQQINCKKKIKIAHYNKQYIYICVY